MGILILGYPFLFQPTPIPTMTTVPIIAYPSGPNATSRNRTTPEDLSMFFDTVQPDNQSGYITDNGCDELGMDGTLGDNRID